MISQSTHPSRRRDKPILSCNFCRGRKLRCDRQSPCSTCRRRGVECVYSLSEQERNDAVDYRAHGRNRNARQRVARIESLVTDMAAQSSQTPLAGVPVPHALEDAATQGTSSDGRSESIGTLSLEDGNTVYTGSSHWATILYHIRQLKDELSGDLTDSSMNPESTSLTADPMGSPATRITLLTSVTCFPREQILAMVPPRRVVDRHLSYFFNTFDFAPVILHRETFIAEYNQFWADFSSAPIMWIGLLFSIMCISIFLQQQDIGSSGLSSEPQAMLENYRTLTIHCLVAGNYLSSSRYTIETLTLHFVLDQNVGLGTHVSTWVLMGVVIRVAMRMGLHRDPGHWPTVRPLQAEFRRRMWMMLYDMDFFTSIQVGLPRIIKDSQCDARPPAHLLDNDISLDHDETPVERPLTEPSSLLYIIQRHRIIKLAAEIYDVTEAGPPSTLTIDALSAKLEETIESIPTWLRHKTLETSIGENPDTILYRMVLDILIHKAVYLLHRRSFVKGPPWEANNRSNKACIDAALAILDHQRRMSEEIQPGGLMYGIRWKVATSLNHEFLQATMMLCFALSRSDEDADPSSTNSLPRRDDILEDLAHVRGLWEMSAAQSTEAQRAVKAISVVLGREGAPNTLSFQGLFQQMDDLEFSLDMTLDPALLGGFGNMMDGLTMESGDADAAPTVP
ncbi:Zn(2)-C6 fungal-type domain-containing protein [Fusarium keratoplasticum]|uniref:Zn(2)-C6 fungal-type domain-containing protein n=1 Tax=Fusarium keratoplasticum TaxID=1328300 RepID=A0ACC0QYZ8_9HYPO|nr:Zn(2)-C6 fungal-type domain-containing protein [Fusarium keratoplasticum]KAI8670783.1 Zn(2)-C6 fungal-type domain-containing protein [Fusarium keratoplasticum]